MVVNAPLPSSSSVGVAISGVSVSSLVGCVSILVLSAMSIASLVFVARSKSFSFPSSSSMSLGVVASVSSLVGSVSILVLSAGSIASLEDCIC